MFIVIIDSSTQLLMPIVSCYYFTSKSYNNHACCNVATLKVCGNLTQGMDGMFIHLYKLSSMNRAK